MANIALTSQTTLLSQISRKKTCRRRHRDLIFNAMYGWLIDKGVDVDVFPVNWNILLTWKYWKKYHADLKEFKLVSKPSIHFHCGPKEFKNEQ